MLYAIRALKEWRGIERQNEMDAGSHEETGGGRVGVAGRGRIAGPNRRGQCVAEPTSGVDLRMRTAERFGACR